MTNDASETRRDLLDPFVLPSETQGRFRMLAVAAVLITWSLGTILMGAPDVLSFQNSPELQVLVERMSTQEGFDVEELRRFAAKLQTSGDVMELHEKLMRRKDGIMLSIALLLLFFMLAGGSYLVIPHVYRRRHRTRPLTEAENPKVLAELRRLASRAGLGRMPEFCSKPGLLDGLAFGTWGQRVIAVAGQPRRLESGWSDLHRAVALHEIGHLANRDVRTREIARSLWLALVAVASVSIVLFFVFGDVTFVSLTAFVLRILISILIAWALWAGLVRLREFYADWRVVAWGYGEALARRLTLTVPMAAGRLAALRLHPSNEERRRLLKDPRPLFRTSRSLAFLTGALLGLLSGNAAMLAVDSVVFLTLPASGLVRASGSFFVLVATVFVLYLALIGALLALGHGATGALGTQVLRSALVDLAEGSDADWGYLGMLYPSMTLVVGIEAGLTLTPLAFFGWKAGLVMVAWFAGAVFLAWLWLVQVRAMARMTLGACPRGSTLRHLAFFLRWMTAIQLAAFSLPVILGRLAVYAAGDSKRLGDLLGGWSTLDVPMALLTLGLIMAAVSLGLGALTQLAILATLVVRLVLRRSRCTDCGHRIRDWRVVGSDCVHCGVVLAPWLHLRPAKPGDAA